MTYREIIDGQCTDNLPVATQRTTNKTVLGEATHAVCLALSSTPHFPHSVCTSPLRVLTHLFTPSSTALLQPIEAHFASSSAILLCSGLDACHHHRVTDVFRNPIHFLFMAYLKLTLLCRRLSTVSKVRPT